MIFFPNAKINIGLNVISKRSDGYHNLESCFCPLNFHDIIEIKKSNSLSFNTSGIKIPGQKNNNLIIKAFEKIKYKTDPIKIFLHKRIPIGSGLGGGSSDGSFTLLAINKLFNLNLKKNVLHNLAIKLGSDCPFFLKNKLSYLTGKGNIIKDLKIDLTDKKIIIITPNIIIPTREAFGKIKIKKSKYSLLKILKNEPIENWKNYIVNDFEDYVFNKFNRIKKIKESLYNNGALFSSLTGSGSSVYGFFDNNFNLKNSSLKNDLAIETTILR